RGAVRLSRHLRAYAGHGAHGSLAQPRYSNCKRATMGARRGVTMGRYFPLDDSLVLVAEAINRTPQRKQDFATPGEIVACMLNHPDSRAAVEAACEKVLSHLMDHGEHSCMV